MKRLNILEFYLETSTLSRIGLSNIVDLDNINLLSD